ncbi:iron permease FTR1 [Pisolithus croceorrhizus]|nr:iron permease FTR1 [Pisolithus croceorrhizus]KAI6127979.1 iron permease FTR1 [Pisolithus croceorrhizus]KAI6158583.1 iron permease FTR1 [Pisolithus thermaeus]
MTQDLFSITIFFVTFRETLEAAVIVSVLLGLVTQIVSEDPDAASESQTQSISVSNEQVGWQDPLKRSKILRRMKLQILLGAAVGLTIAIALGGTFIAIWFTLATNLWNKAEQLWEGIFQLIAALMIFVMGITMLKMDRAKATWRVKLNQAFSGEHVDRRTKSGKWVLFILPMITVLREGMEGVIFVSGVAVGQPATSIPIAAIVGIICGLVCGFFIYQFSSRLALKVFMVVMTNLILLVGAGLFSKAVWAFEENVFQQLVGANVDDTGGTGPGSYSVQGNVWHLNCCSTSTGGWEIFNAVLGWQNSATLGSVISYALYWLAVVATLVFLKFKEGRTKLFGYESSYAKRRRSARERNQEKVDETTEDKVDSGSDAQ